LEELAAIEREVLHLAAFDHTADAAVLRLDKRNGRLDADLLDDLADFESRVDAHGLVDLEDDAFEAGAAEALLLHRDVIPARSSAAVVRSALVSTFFAVTLAPLRTAPEASVTSPTRVAVILCA